jgi:DNA-binding response OmpR family regulator/DNA-binding CsgD family transcriptional regulator
MNEKIEMQENKISAHVLIVDDEFENIQLIGRILMDEGMEFSYASNGIEAIKMASTKYYDLILLDIMMPDMDGYEVCAKIRQNQYSPQSPIIFVTAKTEYDDILRGFVAGGQDYIKKPFHHRELMARARTQIELFRQQQILKKMNRQMIDHLSDKEKQIESQKQELTKGTLILGQKNEMLDTLQKELNNIIQNELKDLQQKLKSHLANLLNVRGSLDKWELFDQNFQAYHSEKLNKLMAIGPELSASELRICEFLLNGLSTKEIAYAMQISHRAVEQARYRIRKKLSIEKGESLLHFLIKAINKEK